MVGPSGDDWSARLLTRVGLRQRTWEAGSNSRVLLGNDLALQAEQQKLPVVRRGPLHLERR